jgi:plastocyanin
MPATTSLVRLLLIASPALLAGSATASSSISGHDLSHIVKIARNAPALGAQAFSPDTLVVSLGSDAQVTWSNADYTAGSYDEKIGTTHTVTADAGEFDSGPLAPNGTFVFRFTSSGTFGYHCRIHPSMVGVIKVTP